MVERTTARIRFVVDFETECMPVYDRLPVLQRCRAMKYAAADLHGRRIKAFKAMMARRNIWRPRLRVDPRTQHPLRREIHNAISNAVDDYNLRSFPRYFQSWRSYFESLGDSEEGAAVMAVGPGSSDGGSGMGGGLGGSHTCVTHYIVDGVVYTEYNYALEPDPEGSGSGSRKRKARRGKGARRKMSRNAGRATVALDRPPRNYRNIFEDSEWPELKAKWRIHISFKMDQPILPGR